MPAQFELMARLALMTYALVTTNKRAVPPQIIGRWLEYVMGKRNNEPCVLCMDRQLEDCGWACLQEVDNE